MLRVLVADDSLESQREIQGLVEAMGHSCTVVSDGVAAVAHAKRSHWDLILMVCSVSRFSLLICVRICICQY